MRALTIVVVDPECRGVRDGDYVEASSDLFSPLGNGVAVLAHPDPHQAHADHEEIRRIEATS